MNVGQFQNLLATSSNAAIRFQLPSGEYIPDHFHVTEVGRVDKQFVDCGGTRRQASSCLLQTWTANDFEHRLKADKLAKILEIAQPILRSAELPVEMEFGSDVAAQYVVSDVVIEPKVLSFVLAARQTDCMAKDKCGVEGCGSSDCCT